MDTTTGSIQYGPSNENDPMSNAYLMNYVNHMTRFAALSNYINIPSDCPTRERRGWLGDGQLAAETLIHNFDMAATYTKWLIDIRDTQIQVNASGALPEVAPWYHHGGAAPGDPAWYVSVFISIPDIMITAVILLIQTQDHSLCEYSILDVALLWR